MSFRGHRVRGALQLYGQAADATAVGRDVFTATYDGSGRVDRQPHLHVVGWERPPRQQGRHRLHPGGEPAGQRHGPLLPHDPRGTDAIWYEARPETDTYADEKERRFRYYHHAYIYLDDNSPPKLRGKLFGFYSRGVGSDHRFVADLMQNPSAHIVRRRESSVRFQRELYKAIQQTEAEEAARSSYVSPHELHLWPPRAWPWRCKRMKTAVVGPDHPSGY
jgi:hypothetical protein